MPVKPPQDIFALTVNEMEPATPTLATAYDRGPCSSSNPSATSPVAGATNTQLPRPVVLGMLRLLALTMPPALAAPRLNMVNTSGRF